MVAEDGDYAWRRCYYLKMKKFIIGFGIFLLFLIILVAILYKTVGPSQAQPEIQKRNVELEKVSTIRDPQKFIESCYQKYIGASLGGKDPVNTQLYVDTLNTCFTTSFINQSMLSSEESGDPVVHSQTFSPDWITLIQVKLTDASAHRYRVVLGNGPTKKSLLVIVVLEGNKFKIDNVLNDDGT